MSIFRRYAYAWITIVFFLGALVLHWLFGWYAFQDEALQHGQSPVAEEYLNEMLRDTFEKLAVGVPAAPLAGRGSRLLPLHRLAFVQGE